MAFPMLELWCGPTRRDADDTILGPGVRENREYQTSPVVSRDLDVQLVRQIRSRNPDALSALMRSYTESLWRFAYSYVSSRATAHEIVHDVFVALWELGERWQVTGTVRAYLFSSVRNRALNVRKHDLRMQRFAHRVQAWDEPPAMGEPPCVADDAMLRTEQRELLMHAIASLPLNWRQAVTLRVQEQLSYDEIAVALGVSAGAARKLVERAQKDLRTRLAPYLDHP